MGESIFKMKYTLRDAFQAALGAFSSVLVFVALRSGEQGPFINQTVGLIITFIWLGVLFKELNP